MKVLNPPGSGKDIAKTKGVRREEESEGRWRQISGLTNRNLIRLWMRVRLPHKSKPNNYTESFAVNAFDTWMERKFSNNPWARYADDGVIHCMTEKQAIYIMDKLKARMESATLRYTQRKAESYTAGVGISTKDMSMNHSNF